MPERTIAVRVDEEMYKKIRVRLVDLGISLKDYIVTLINEDINSANVAEWGAGPASGSVSKETLAEAQKVLDFVANIMNGNYDK